MLVQRLTSLMGSGDQFLAVRPQAGSTTPYPLEGLPVIILVPRERDIQLQMEDGEGGGKGTSQGEGFGRRGKSEAQMQRVR